MKKIYIYTIIGFILSIITKICNLAFLNFLCIYITIMLSITSLILIISNLKVKNNRHQKSKYKYENYQNYDLTYNLNNEIDNYTFNGKLNNRILSDNEYTFFYQLKRITDKYNFLIFPKLRMADIFTTYNKKDFGKVQSKHIDFTICNWYSKPIMFIELDDYSHNKKENRDRDIKKDKIFKCMKIKLYRVKVNNINLGLYDIESGIKMYIYNLKNKVGK